MVGKIILTNLNNMKVKLYLKQEETHKFWKTFNETTLSKIWLFDDNKKFVKWLKHDPILIDRISKLYIDTDIDIDYNFDHVWFEAFKKHIKLSNNCKFEYYKNVIFITTCDDKAYNLFLKHIDIMKKNIEKFFNKEISWLIIKFEPRKTLNEMAENLFDF